MYGTEEKSAADAALQHLASEVTKKPCLARLVERGMLTPIREGARQYTVGFTNSFLIRGVIRALANEGFIPDTLNNSR